MKSTIKLVMTATGMVLIVVGVAAILLLPYAESVLRQRLERILAEAVGAPVHIDAISFSPLKQCLDLNGFTIDNPEGFKKGAAFVSERIRLEFDPRSLFDRAPVIRDTRIEGAEIFYRHEIGKGVNIKKLSEHADAFLATERNRRFVLEEVHCDNAKVHFSTNLIPKARIGLNLVNLSLKNVADAHPITALDATAIILRSITHEVLTLRGLLPSSDEEEEPEAEAL